MPENQTKDIDAAINCMGYGYSVKVVINGTDIGMKGGMSEGKRLFSAEHSMKSEAAPEIREQLFVLKKGDNIIHIEFTKTGADPDRLTIDLQAGESAEPVFSFASTDPSGTVDKTLVL